MSAARLVAVVVAAFTVTSTDLSAQEVSLKEVLARAAAYAAHSQQELSGIVAEAVVDVRYAFEPGLGFLVPFEMREVYEARDDQRVEGHARYGGFRRFQVRVDATIKAVKQ